MMPKELTEESVKTLKSYDTLSRLMFSYSKVSVLSHIGLTDPMLDKHRRDSIILRQELVRRLEFYDVAKTKRRNEKMEEKPLGRRFTIPNEYDPATGVITGGDLKCLHDYPEEVKKIERNSISWQCVWCGQIRTYKKEAAPKKYIRT